MSVAAVVLAVVFAVLHFLSERVPALSLRGKRFIITGGSSGIGLETARLLVQKQAGVVAIVARDAAKLKEAVSLLQASNTANTTTVVGLSCDVSDHAATKKMIDDFALEHKGLDVLLACAGYSTPDYFTNLKPADFQRMMNVNYFGCVYTAHAAVPHMQKQKTGGRLVFVSSMAGLLGTHGYTAYSPTKFAVRGLAESLCMELKPHNISVSVVVPPDVDTPGYVEENKTKPEECRKISEGTGVFTAQAVALDIVDGIENYKWMISTGFDGKILTTLTAGFSPCSNGIEATVQVLSAGILRVVSLVYRYMYDGICLSVHSSKKKLN